MKHLVLMLAFVMMAVPGCRAEEGTATPYPEVLSIENHQFHVDIADTTEKRTIGLMFRDKMGADSGMLFVFDDEIERAFWMKNTLIPLDMLFIDRSGKIIHIHESAIPHDLTPVPSKGPAFAVLEINGGRAKTLGLTPGMIVKHKVFANTLAVPPPIH